MPFLKEKCVPKQGKLQDEAQNWEHLGGQSGIKNAQGQNSFMSYRTGKRS